MTSTTTANHTLTTTHTWTAVLLDLDGTIVDSAPGIIAALGRTFEQLGLPVPGHDELLEWVGPPMLQTFQQRLGLDEAGARAALELYRADYLQDATATAVFPGMAGLIERLHRAGMPIALATSKPESTARVILEHFDLARYFTAITGANDDETRSTKSQIVAEALLRLRAAGVDTSRSVMVGDREYDALGAASQGVPTLLVEWGYGSPDEARDAIGTVYSADQLAKKLLG